MVALKRDSLVWRLLLLLGGAFAVTALLVFLMVNVRVSRVLRERGLEVYGQRAESIVRELDRQAQRLALTGQEEAYRADFQEAALRNLSDVHYREADPDGFPFVVDGHGVIQMHPWYPRGDLTYFDEFTHLREAGATSGQFAFVGRDGERHVAVVRYEAPWDWFVAYCVPERLLAAEARQIEAQLLVAWGIATVLVLAALAWLLIRETRPLLVLADAAEAMARGDLDREVEEERPGEVGVLARGFVHMRGAIRRQLAELRESEARYRKIFDAGADGLLLLDHDGTIVAANPAAGAIYGWSPQQLQGRSITSLLRDGDAELAQALRLPPADKPVHLEGITCNRERQQLETEISAVRLSFQGRSHAMVILRDVTEQRHLERQLLQSQKLETVGRLAGGIAHDFNNLLTPVLGYTEMLLEDPDLSAEARADLTAIQRAGERARGLARQLLAFSRRQVLEMRSLNLGETLREFAPILRRTLSEDIELVIDCQDADCQVHADASQVEQIIMNLAINAMDAMPDGGRVEILTVCRRITADAAGSPAGAAPGTYTSLVVRDTGTGVSPEILDRVFEPFFTTKEVGKGTGLGLATIHGIVSQHGGWVGLRNRPEGGCEVEILLPSLPTTSHLPDSEPAADDGRRQPGRGELIWLVEDDIMVRELVQNMLTRNAYRVQAFESADLCLATAESGVVADLVITDVVMPDLNGPELRDRLRERGLTMPVLFMSGYAGDALVRRGLADIRADFINKPIDPGALLQKLRRMLDASRERSS
ncbi:MAG: response regulator [Candidatus Krumholzibacteriia bacterium]